MAKKTNITESQFSILHSALFGYDDLLTKTTRKFYEEYGYTKEEVPEYMHGEYEQLQSDRDCYEKAMAILWDVIHDFKEKQE